MILRTIAISVATTVALATGCDQADPVAKPCRDIPSNGCPLLDDDSECADPCCAAAYACDDGESSFEHTCSGFWGCDAGTTTVADDAGGYCDVGAIDAPVGASGGPGCEELEAPDCPLSEALVCSATPCLGCDDFFACVNGGWIRWAGCLADGGVELKY